MENILFVILIVFMLLVVPTCAAMYIVYTKSKMTTEEWAKKQVEEQKRVKEAQKNPIWWSMHL
jgi:flagellar basal body-associated protein FliL